MLPGPRSRCARGHARPCQGWPALTADDRDLWLGARDSGSGQRHRTGHTGSLESLPMAILGAKKFQNYIDEEWVLCPAPKRGEVLFRFAQLLAEHKDDVTELMTHEMGKVRAEAAGDVQEAIDMAFYMGGEGRRLFGQTTPSELPDKFQMSVRMPVGVVGAITPWNFPIAIPSWKTLPAIVCGNTVVFKPATDTPALGERYVELFAEAGLPKGVL